MKGRIGKAYRKDVDGRTRMYVSTEGVKKKGGEKEGRIWMDEEKVRMEAR
jgi:hypothetical protein